MSEGGGISEDTLLGGRVRLRQPIRGHRAGTDAVLLAGLCGAKPGDRVVDLGSASGAVGLMVAARVPAIKLVMVDRDPDLIALARENAALNGASASAFALDLLDDVRAWPDLGQASRGCDLAVTNPPYFDEQPRPSPNPAKRRAHLMQGGDLSGWVRAARLFLKPRGQLVVIGRADRLASCIAAVRNSFGSLRVVPIYPSSGTAAIRVVISGKLGGGAADILAPPLVLHDENGCFTEAAAALHR